MNVARPGGKGKPGLLQPECSFQPGTQFSLNLRVFAHDRVLENVCQRAEQLRRRLATDCTGLRHVGDVRQWGLMVGIELVRNRDTREPYPAAARIGMRTIKEARTQGVILRPLSNTIVLMPPLCITEAQVDLLCDVTRDAITAATEMA